MKGCITKRYVCLLRKTANSRIHRQTNQRKQGDLQEYFLMRSKTKKVRVFENFLLIESYSVL